MSLAGLFEPLAALFGHAQIDPALDQAVARAVELVEPRLKLLGDYPARFRQGVARSLAHAHDLALKVPGPVDLDPERFARDPWVHALFVSLDEVMAGMCVSQPMRDYIQAHPCCGEVYGLLGMRRWQKRVLGMALEGDRVRREVPQEVVYFNSHTLGHPAETEAACREAMAWGFFDALLKQVRARIDGRYLEKIEAEQTRDALLARLRQAGPETRPALELEYRQQVAHLQTLASGLDLHKLADDFDAILLAPADHLYLETVTRHLDGMGVVQDEAAAGGEVHVLTFTDLLGYDRRRWTVCLVHCSDIGDGTISGRLEHACRILSL